MKRERHLVDQRREQILALARSEREVRVDDLAERFRTSTMTIRRDLQVLEDRGQLARFYGGASIVEKDAEPLSRDDEILLYRRRIAEYASKLVEPDDTVFINGSSTAMGLLDHLNEKPVVIITNNGSCMKYIGSETIRIIVTGGRVLKNTPIMVGDSAARLLDETRADKAFLGFTGISDDGEVICSIPAEMRINELMLSNCNEYFIMVDHTKIGKMSSFASSALDRPGTIITDEKADAGVCERLRHYGMTVHQVTLHSKSNKSNI